MTTNILQQKSDQQAQARRQVFEQFTIEGFSKTLFIFAVVVTVVGVFTNADIKNFGGAFHEFYANVSSEALSVLITVVVLERLNARRQDAQELRRLKALLGSNEAVVTKIAVAELKARGWLNDGSLTGANLQVANLTEAYLVGADLTNAYLFAAKLTNAYLFLANLTNAYLFAANLTNAYLFDANLTNATLYLANLTDANLISANLTEANLGNANLTNANLEDANLTDANLVRADLTNARFNEQTILPDGTNWSPDTDMARFTDPL